MEPEDEELSLNTNRVGANDWGRSYSFVKS